MAEIVVCGVEDQELREALDRGIDHGGNPIEPFVDVEGGWDLRCCLSDSVPGAQLAIIAWSPFSWSGPYAEVGPVVVHATRCPATGDRDRLPKALDGRAMTLRPYGTDRTIAYEKVRHVPSGESLTAHLSEMLDDAFIDVVHGRNVTGGCFAFQARRR